MRKILFNTVRKTKNNIEHLEHLFSNYELIRSKFYSEACLELLKPRFGEAELFLTHSATGGLELIALLLDIQPGDEIILPSFTFVSSVNAFASKGAIPVFVDIDAENLNLDLNRLEELISPKTKAILAVHYGGHSCDMNRLKAICQTHKLFLIEDAAMAFGNSFEGKALGSIGDFGVISFDITKQISAIQGGLLLVNNPSFKKRADCIYHIGTNRSEFIDGSVPYYEWVDHGSKFQLNELNATVLLEQLKVADEILKIRKELSKIYYRNLYPLSEAGHIQLMPKSLLADNVHEFYILIQEFNQRKQLVEYLQENGIEAFFHYIPLHNSTQGKRISRHRSLKNTEEIADSLLRLPLHSELTEEEVLYTCSHILNFFSNGK